MSNYLDNIKLIASELSNMAPRTQMELIKLCKDLCINTKNYLVAFDETTLPALDARIEALESLTSDLSSELSVAEGNITANANAISTIQDAISTIETALSNVYTKSQIDTMLASYYTKSQIDTMFASYYNKNEVDNALALKANKATTYTKTEVDNALANKANASDVYAKSETYTKTEVDNALADKQATLVSGTNIKTINNTSLLGSGNINIGGGGGGATYYKHQVDFNVNDDDMYVQLLIINTSNTPLTSFNAIYNALLNNGPCQCMIQGDLYQGNVVPLNAYASSNKIFIVYIAVESGTLIVSYDNFQSIESGITDNVYTIQ